MLISSFFLLFLLGFFLGLHVEAGFHGELVRVSLAFADLQPGKRGVVHDLRHGVTLLHQNGERGFLLSLGLLVVVDGDLVHDGFGLGGGGVEVDRRVRAGAGLVTGNAPVAFAGAAAVCAFVAVTEE